MPDHTADGDAERTDTMTIKVDTSKTPKTIDILFPEKGRDMLGIYEIKGDELHLCASDSGKDRPTEFSAKEGSGWRLATFKRVKK
jgi:uncharacterized protein (TIGR03067 family)